MIDRDEAYANLIAELEALPRFLIQGQGMRTYAELITVLMRYLDATGANWQISAFLSLLRSDASMRRKLRRLTRANLGPR